LTFTPESNVIPLSNQGRSVFVFKEWIDKGFWRNFKTGIQKQNFWVDLCLDVKLWYVQKYPTEMC